MSLFARRMSRNGAHDPLPDLAQTDFRPCGNDGLAECMNLWKQAVAVRMIEINLAVPGACTIFVPYLSLIHI